MHQSPGDTWFTECTLRPAGLSLVPNCQNDSGLSIIAIQHDITTVAIVDQPFPILRFHFLYGSSDGRLLSKDCHTFMDGFDRSSGCIGVIFS